MKVIVYVILVTLFFGIGLLLNKDFISYSYSILDTGNIDLIRNINDTNSISIFLFPMITGLIPMFYLLISKTTKVKFLYKGLIASFIILLFGVLFWRLRIFGLNANFEELSGYNLPNGLKQQLNVRILKFEVYLLLGFIVGTLISILIFRDKSKSLLN